MRARTEEIVSFDCELNVYRKGCLSVSINLQQGMIIWRNSHQWCNNFIRSLTADQVLETRGLIQSMDIMNHLAEVTDQDGDDTEPPARTGIKLTIIMPDRQLSYICDVDDQDIWLVLQREIEKLSRVPFQL